MSMQPRSWPQPAQEITKAVLAMYAGREAPLPVVVRDELDELFADEQFARAFGVRGKPGWSPGRLALITALQMAENMTDSQAAEAVRLRLDWKYALGLELTDPGFDASVLSEFRTRVVAHAPGREGPGFAGGGPGRARAAQSRRQAAHRLHPRAGRGA
jgi:hypothetical protein